MHNNDHTNPQGTEYATLGCSCSIFFLENIKQGLLTIGGNYSIHLGTTILHTVSGNLLDLC